MIRYVPFFLSTLLLLIATMPVRAEIPLLRYGFDNWPPFSMSAKRPYTGIDFEIASELAKRLNARLRVMACPFKRCLKEMEDGGLDMFSGVARNPDREKYMRYADTPYHAVSVVFHVRKGESRILEKYEDLYRLRVGSVLQSHYFDPFNTDTKINRFEVHEEQQLIKMLVNNRIDTYVGTNPNASYEARQLGFKPKIDLAAFAPGDGIVPVHYAFSRKSHWHARVDELNQHIMDMKADGTIERILSHYQ